MLSVFGAFQYPVRMAGDAVFLYTFARFHIRRQQSLLQSLLRTRAAFGPAGGKAEAVEERAASKIFAQPLVPVWLPDVLHDYVRIDAVQYLSGIYRRAPFQERNASLGVQAPMAVGGCELCGSMDRTVRFWLFWSDAYLYSPGTSDNGIVPAPFLVRVLPNGDDDPGNLQAKEWKEGKGIWKNRPGGSQTC